MITRFPGTCACGCGRRYPGGAEVTRAAAGWVLVACGARAPAASSGQFHASPAEILEILARARAVATRPAPVVQPALQARSAR